MTAGSRAVGTSAPRLYPSIRRHIVVVCTRPTALESVGHVAAVQFSRAAERATGGIRRRAGLSKLNSMRGLELRGVRRPRAPKGLAPAAPRDGNAADGLPRVREPAGPARSGRRTRPHGRKPTARFRPRRTAQAR
jgi:hypothetical protein